MNIKKRNEFRKKIWEYYKKNKRNFPWRETTNPYHILVSEMMLQQTQTSRVIRKYEEFLKKFSTIHILAKASNEDVLRLWSGLGYNRRALYLKRIAQILGSNMSLYKNTLPEKLKKLPGIGPNTAGAIYVFSTNKPYVFIETNIRRVFIHEFFKDQANIPDKEILKLIEQTIDRTKPRDWYYALMDYGSFLGKLAINPNLRSRHYTKQSKFEGSIRQARGEILKTLLEKKNMSPLKLEKQFKDKEQFKKALDQLKKEGFVEIDQSNMVKLKL